MAIKTGRYGSVSYDSTASSPLSLSPLIALNNWKLSLRTDYEEVSQFGDTNKVYVPGLRDVSGSLSGFWDSTNTKIFDATTAVTPGVLRLVPNTNETLYFEGPAYLDADIDCSLAVPKVSANFKAAGTWIMDVD